MWGNSQINMGKIHRDNTLILEVYWFCLGKEGFRTVSSLTDRSEVWFILSGEQMKMGLNKPSNYPTGTLQNASKNRWGCRIQVVRKTSFYGQLVQHLIQWRRKQFTPSLTCSSDCLSNCLTVFVGQWVTRWVSSPTWPGKEPTGLAPCNHCRWV